MLLLPPSVYAPAEPVLGRRKGHGRGAQATGDQQKTQAQERGGSAEGGLGELISTHQPPSRGQERPKICGLCGSGWQWLSKKRRLTCLSIINNQSPPLRAARLRRCGREARCAGGLPRKCTGAGGSSQVAGRALEFAHLGSDDVGRSVHRGRRSGPSRGRRVLCAVRARLPYLQRPDGVLVLGRAQAGYFKMPR
jgi:hypothetical protein